MAIGDIEVGARLGPYLLTRRVGAGAMGEVFAAERDGGSRVAIKYVGRSHATDLHRFKREFRALADIRHPNLVDLRELVVLPDQRAFYTMELIDGQVFHKYVRSGSRDGHLPNLVRLRRALRQLLAGLCHIHAAGFVHRDLKPSNVLVTREGRVVVLDFGLISERESNKMSLAPTGMLLGTPSYIAPEHAAQQRADKPADLYAVGVMLYQALSGVLPFRGSAARMLVDKQERAAPPVTEVVTEVVPDELVELCRRLLERDPAARPMAPEALALVDPSARVPVVDAAASHASLRATLAGRTELLDTLDELLGDVRANEAVTVHLRECVGAGRGTLLDGFIGRLRDATSEQPPLILRGRCRERESVPYKGLDPLVDSLTLQLRNLGTDEVVALRPKRIIELIQMFPVMSSVWPSRTLPPVGLDRAELRSFGQASLRELLTRAGLRHTLVVCVEDFHWSDVESARILSELARTPGAPRMLLIVSHADQNTSEALDIMYAEEHLRGRKLVELEVGPLSPDETRAMARELLGDRLVSLSLPEQAACLDEYVARSGGDPFHLGQLVAQAGGRGATEVESIDRLVVRRLFELDEPAQRLLGVVAACDSLCSAELATRVMGDDVSELLEQLTVTKLLLEPSPGKYQTADPRIREVLLAELEADELVALHRALAQAFSETGDASFEALANHLVQAGERARASAYFERAAKQAAEALAFELAIHLYRRALRTLTPDADRPREWTVRAAIAQQLINVGRGHEAIELLLELAPEVEAGRSRDYRRQAAELLLRAGRVDEGLALITALLEELGESAPQSRTGIMAKLGLGRLARRLRARSQPRVSAGDGALASPEQLERLDTLAIWTALADPEARLTGPFQARYLCLALEALEPLRLSRGYAQEAVRCASEDNEQEARGHLEAARSVLGELDEPVYRALVDHLEAEASVRLHRWREAATSWARLLYRIRKIPRVQYVRAVAASRYVSALLVLGEARALANMAPSWLMATREFGYRREDAIIAAGTVRGLLMLGEDTRGLGPLLERARRWEAPNYSAPNLALDLCEIAWASANGDFGGALLRCDRALAEAERSQILGVESVSTQLIELRGRTCVAALVSNEGPADARRRAELAKQARADARRLRKSRWPMHRGQAAVIDAALALADGEREAAQRGWSEAAAAFADAQMSAHLAAVRYRLDAAGREGDDPDDEGARAARCLAPGQ